MLKRIIYLERGKKSRQKIIKKISPPIEEANITKTQLQNKNYIIVDADKCNEQELIKTERKKGKQHIHHWDEKNQKIMVEYKDLSYEEMSLEDKVDYLYNQLQTLLNNKHHKNISEADE